MRKAIVHLKRSDPVLAAIIERVGPFRMEYVEPAFHSLAEAIIYQQLHGKAAATIFRRLTNLAGNPLMPDEVLKVSQEQLRSVGLSKQKIAYLRDLADKTQSGAVDFRRFPELPDAEAIKQLIRVKGIGVWTAHMFLMFSLRRLDVLPVGDLGIQMAIRKHYRKRQMPKPQHIEKIARPWSPYRTVACWYLWQSLDTKTL